MNRRRISAAAAMFAGLALLGTSCGSKSSPAADLNTQGPIEVGAEAPNFELPSAQGTDVSLADFAGKKPVLLFFSMGPG